jgi:hypothetical protein
VVKYEHIRFAEHCNSIFTWRITAYPRDRIKVYPSGSITTAYPGDRITAYRGDRITAYPGGCIIPAYPGGGITASQRDRIAPFSWHE